MPDDFAAQQAAVGLPAKASLNAAEVLNWIAFGAAVDADLSGIAEFRSKWGFEPSAAENVMKALSEIEAGAEDPEISRSPWGGRSVRKLARRLTDEWIQVLPAPYLRLAIEKWVADHDQRTSALFEAHREILEQAFAGTLSVIARPANPADRLPSGNMRTLDPVLFATPGARLRAWGELWIGEDRFIDVTFRAIQVAELWPARPPSTEPQEAPQVTSEAEPQIEWARAWMLEQLRAGKSLKRQAAIKECTEAASKSARNVTWRVAEAAWNSLPEPIKGTRGKHKS